MRKILLKYSCLNNDLCTLSYLKNILHPILAYTMLDFFCTLYLAIYSSFLRQRHSEKHRARVSSLTVPIASKRRRQGACFCARDARASPSGHAGIWGASHGIFCGMATYTFIVLFILLGKQKNVPANVLSCSYPTNLDL